MYHAIETTIGFRMKSGWIVWAESAVLTIAVPAAGNFWPVLGRRQGLL